MYVQDLQLIGPFFTMADYISSMRDGITTSSAVLLRRANAGGAYLLMSLSGGASSRTHTASREISSGSVQMRRSCTSIKRLSVVGRRKMKKRYITGSLFPIEVVAPLTFLLQFLTGEVVLNIYNESITTQGLYLTLVGEESFKAIDAESLSMNAVRSHLFEMPAEQSRSRRSPPGLCRPRSVVSCSKSTSPSQETPSGANERRTSICSSGELITIPSKCPFRAKA